MTDQELLRAYVDRGDEGAFRALVDRHIRAVHAAAKRQVRDNQLAEDVAQATFVMLARKADSIRDGAVVAGWLITTARLAAKTALRGEIRRKRREQRAAATMSYEQQSPSNRAAGDAATEVEHADTLGRVDAAIDDALAKLNPADRTAVTLRYLEARPLREVAELMGTTEQAAAKRTTRAVEKMRKIFRRRGINLAPAMLIEVFERQAQVDLPPNLAEGAVAAWKAGPRETAAGVIATATLSRASRRVAVVGAAALLLVIIGGITVAIWLAKPTPQSVTRVLPPTPVSLTPLRVGVYISHATAVHKNEIGKPRGWADQVKILEELTPHADGLDIRPLIEPGSEAEPQTATKLAQYFPGRQPVNVEDAAGLRREVDVILACAVCEPTQPAIDAIESAVRSGTGLVIRQCFGGHSDGLGGYAHPQVRMLRGLVDADPDMARGWAKQVTLEVSGTHPILGALSGRRGAKITSIVYGGYGSVRPDSTLLVTVRDLAPFQHLTTKTPLEPHEGWTVAPLNVFTLDQGRVVSCDFAVARVPQELDDATGGKFTVNSLKWAAKRDVN